MGWTVSNFPPVVSSPTPNLHSALQLLSLITTGVSLRFWLGGQMIPHGMKFIKTQRRRCLMPAAVSFSDAYWKYIVVDIFLRWQLECPTVEVKRWVCFSFLSHLV
jgi:hypothetical protein